MNFTSLTFLIFFALFFLIYWFIAIRSLKMQNLFILLAGYVFYAWADYRLLSYLICVSALNFYLGILIEQSFDSKRRRLFVAIGLLQGIGGLVFFKYLNFFIDSLRDAFSSLGIHLSFQTLNIVAPVGISFFTFRTISYLLDIDKGKIKAARDWVIFFNYVSFFPCILSGPIDRAKNFIPQLGNPRVFNYQQAVDGLRQILWGLFKKIVIADSCAKLTTQIFDQYQTLPASTLVVGPLLFTFQIYADFSGYSDIAIGLGNLLGFRVTKNFAFPLFSQNIAEFWRRWHISLTSWLTEYVFTPLSIAFRDYGQWGLILSILINFLIIGIWHGPNWTYILYGFIHGCFFIPLILRGTIGKNPKIAKGKLLPSFAEFMNVIMTMSLVMLTFILFRSENISDAYHYYGRLFSSSFFTVPIIPNGRNIILSVLPFLSIMLLVEWLQREKDHGLQIDGIRYSFVRWVIYYSIFLSILQFNNEEVQFIYYQY